MYTISGSLLQFRNWWSGLLSSAHHFGYHVNVAKTWLVVREECLVSAQHIFSDSGIEITSAGQPYLGAALGSSIFRDYTQDHITEWTQGLSQLSSIAASQPHTAYAAFLHGFSSKWNYYLHTNPNICDLLSPLESTVRQQFLPPPPSDLERELFSLPVSLGFVTFNTLLKTTINFPMNYIRILPIS